MKFIAEHVFTLLIIMNLGQIPSAYTELPLLELRSQDIHLNFAITITRKKYNIQLTKFSFQSIDSLEQNVILVIFEKFSFRSNYAITYALCI